MISTSTSHSTLEAGLRNLLLKDYLPRRQLRTRHTSVPRSCVPSIDIHNHLGTWLSEDGTWLVPDATRLIELMQQSNVRHIVNLDGRWGTELDANLRRYDEQHPGLVSTFCQVDFRMLGKPSSVSTAALVTQLRQGASRGAKGLKVWKDLGLEHRDEHGMIVLPDSPLVEPIFETAGELGLPVLIHTADPIAFFQPFDRFNERLENLLAFPDWWFGSADFPEFDRLIDALEQVIAAHPGTTFIGAHVGCAAEDLARVDQMLSSYPNYHIDLGGRMPELGRQPRAARKLIIDHPLQVLFGTDAYPISHQEYAQWFRFLETDDECFCYGPDDEVPSMGRWEVSALDLPTTSLEALYAGNAARLLSLT